MYIQFSKDINKIKNTLVWIFTIRETLIFLVSVALGFTLYFLIKDSIGYEISSYVLAAFMIIPGFLIFYSKNGMKAEKVFFYKFKRIAFGKIRPYKTENIYSQIENEIKKQGVNKIVVSDKKQKQANINKKVKK